MCDKTTIYKYQKILDAANELLDRQEKVADELLDYFKSNQLRLPTNEELKWLICAELEELKWLQQLFKKDEIQRLWNKKLLCLAVMSKSETCDLFRPKQPGVFVLRPIRQCTGLVVTVVLEYDAPSAEGSKDKLGKSRKFRELREFFISPEEIEKNQVLGLIKKKKWLLTPLKYVNNMTYDVSTKSDMTGEPVEPQN